MVHEVDSLLIGRRETTCGKKLSESDGFSEQLSSVSQLNSLCLKCEGSAAIEAAHFLTLDL